MKSNSLVILGGIGLLLYIGVGACSTYKVQPLPTTDPSPQAAQVNKYQSKDSLVVRNNQDGSVAIVGRPSDDVLKEIYGKDVSDKSFYDLYIDQDSHWLRSYGNTLIGEQAKKDTTKEICALFFKKPGVDSSRDGRGMNQTPFDCKTGLEKTIQKVLTRDIIEMVVIKFDPKEYKIDPTDLENSMIAAVSSTSVIVNPVQQAQ